MSAPPIASAVPLTGFDDLVAWFAAGNKPRADWRVGTEHEKFMLADAHGTPAPFDGPNGIEAVLEALAQREGWTRHLEGNRLIALSRGGANITLEPGGQFELSGAPLRTLHETAAELERHFIELRPIAEEMGLSVLPVGFHPWARREDVPWMPKGRYGIMGRYMPKVGKLGHDMMLRTCTVQANLDFSSEGDMATKMRVGIALQPLATALFATSPFREGHISGLNSTRANVWLDTDGDRTGEPPGVFDAGFGFEAYARWALSVPMYFVWRDGRFIDAAGQSFADFMDGRLPALPGELPLVSDWADHLTTLFPEVRLKRYLEMRGADAGPPEMLRALPAFWTGLLYDDAALDAATQLVKPWSAAERAQLRHDTPRAGLSARIHGRTLMELALELLPMAAEGLARRRHVNGFGEDESIYLAPLQEIVSHGRNLSDLWLQSYQTDWNRDLSHLISIGGV